MRKRLIVGACTCILLTLLGGCRTSFEDYLAFEDTAASADYTIDNRLTQAGFFAENLAIAVEGEADEELTSGASLLVNMADNQVLYADHVYDRLYPASLTKLMTALVVLQYGELTDTVTVSHAASHISQGGIKLCGFQEGDILTLDALLKCLLVYSGNDAAIAIADHISGSEEAFVARMNEEAKKIGAVHTNYVNSNGLHEDEQYTTAYDVYLIFNELLKYDTFRSVIVMDSYTANYQDRSGNQKEKTFKSTNSYLRGDAEVPDGIQIIGGKTGTTKKAGNCLVLLSKNAAEEELISVILKSPDSSALYSQMSYMLEMAAEE
ncbi:D-alanyl-D-alanine carboxypeptidase [Anaerotaenia torta]|uniref:D-alanyl-D-alanine carboxypeptidase family protein n=1 Tax=Anaerotaenia torta TaxID=433293 RepID=UPI003D25093B